MSDFFSDSELTATGLPPLGDVLAAFVRPERHAGDVIVVVNGFHVWKPRADLAEDEGFVAFFGGDYRAVLEPDDPRIAR